MLVKKDGQLLLQKSYGYASLELAAPIPDPATKKKRITLKGDVPSPIDPPAGCRFHPRCPHRFDPCDKAEPELKQAGGDHIVASGATPTREIAPGNPSTTSLVPSIGSRVQ